jgi:transposase
VTCRNATGLENRARAAAAVDRGRHLGQDPGGGDRQGRRGGRGGVGDQCRLLGSTGSPARRWSPKKGGCTATVDALAVEGEGLGRSRGGLSTKIHLAVDRRGRPLRVLLTPGQAGDNPQLLPLLDGIRVARVGPGRPRSRPEMVIADKAYSHPSTRQALRDRKIRFVSPERDDQIARRAARGSRGGRPTRLRR